MITTLLAQTMGHVTTWPEVVEYSIGMIVFAVIMWALLR